jgi:glycosyltransferase involved in cell wall biosynthesis
METYSFELASELQAITHLTVIKMSNANGDRLGSVFFILGFLIRNSLRLALWRRYDVVHVGDPVLWPLAFFAKVFSRRPCRLVMSVFGLDIAYAFGTQLLSHIYRVYLRTGVRLLKDSVECIAISHATAELCRRVGLCRLTVIPLGVRHCEKHHHGEACQSSSYILFVGRLVKRKGLGWFIANVLPRLDPHLTLKVVGPKWDVTEWEALNSCTRAEYLGCVDRFRLAELRREAIAVVMPNIGAGDADIEGFGLTALEAAADGGVLIASRIEGLIDAVIDNQTGFLIDEKDVDGWLRCLERVTKWSLNERRLFTATAAKKLREEFSWVRVARRTLDTYAGAPNQPT